MESPLLLLYPNLSSLRNDRSINLNLSDHMGFLRETWWSQENMTIVVYKVQKECFICDDITRYEQDT